MKKKAGPPLKLELPELVDCSACKGKRFTKGVFYEIPCSGCDGLGKVDEETGEALPVHIGYPALAKTIDWLRRQNRELKQHVIVSEPDPYANSGPYKGD